MPPQLSWNLTVLSPDVGATPTRPTFSVRSEQLAEVVVADVLDIEEVVVEVEVVVVEVVEVVVAVVVVRVAPWT